MQTFAILGFTFGLIAFAMAGKLSRDIKTLQRQVEDLKKQLLVTSDSH